MKFQGSVADRKIYNPSKSYCGGGLLWVIELIILIFGLSDNSK